MAIEPCNLAGVGVSCLVIEGDLRYVAVVPEHPVRLVLVDLGGPGQSIETQAESIANLRLALDDKESVFVSAAEFWSNGLSIDCETATSRWINSVRFGERSTDTENWWTACQADVEQSRSWATDYETLQQVFVEFGEDLPATYIGWSFASRNMAAVLSSPVGEQIENWVLFSPISRSKSLEDLLNIRGQRSLRFLEEACAINIVDCDIDDSLSSASRVAPFQVEGRSTPVTSVDLLAATYGASYEPVINSEWLWSDLDNIENGSHSDLIIPRAADSVLRRYDVESHAPDIAGYLLGICANYGQADKRLGQPLANQISEFLVALHEVCLDRPEQEPGNQRESSLDWDIPGCILIGDSDPLAAETSVLRNEWSAEIVEIAISGHGLSLTRPEILQTLETASGAHPCGT